MRSILFVLTLLTVSFTGVVARHAGNASVSGIVLDEKALPLEFANVLLLNRADSSLVKGAVTDSAGAYLFEEVEPGAYLISATMVGYDALYSEPFELAAGQADLRLPTLRFRVAGVALDEVVVKAARPFIELLSDRLVVNVESSPVAAGNNALDLLAKVPGVSIDQDQRISLKGKTGVLVLIDGKQTYMSTEDLAKMLQTMPAGSITAIEVMHNPSAKYEAAGNAGIINIRLKKDKNIGLNGTATLYGGEGRYPKGGGGLRFNYRRKQVNLYGNYDYYYNQHFQSVGIDRLIAFEGLRTTFDQSSYLRMTNRGHQYRGGVDWYAGKHTTIGLLFNGRTGASDFNTDSDTRLLGDNPEPFSLIDAANTNRENATNRSYNLNLRREFARPGQELTFDADYSSFRNRADQAFANRFYDVAGREAQPTSYLRSRNASDVTIRAIKADYVHPLPGDARLETGWKSSFVETDNGIRFETLRDETWENDTNRTNQFIYREDIHAGYFNLSKKLGQASLMLGVRAEYTRADGRSVTLGEHFQRGYLDWFPSLSLSHPVGEHHQLSYAYSRRIDRPSYQDLNPFLYFLDPYTYLRGNPDLKPQYTNSVSLTYGLRQWLHATLSYSRTREAITEVLEQDDATRTAYETRRNLDNLDNYSLNLSFPITLTTWWTTRVNASGFYLHFESPFMENGRIDNKQWTYQLNLSQHFTLPLDIKAEISGFYQSRLIWGIYRIDPRWAIDLGLSRDFLDGRGNLRLSLNDIFFTNINRIVVRQDNIHVDIDNRRETRRAYLTFTYKFGNQEMKSERRRSTATETEQSRVK